MPPQETKDRILDAAERLFARNGFDGTSLRGITAEAGVNLAAVNYHFGSKEALLAAVFDRRLAPINRERLAMLDEIEDRSGASPPSPEEVLRAFLMPPFRKTREWGPGGADFMQLAGRMHSEANSRIRGLFIGQFSVVLARFSAALRRAHPDLSLAELHWRLHFVIGAMAHTLIWKDADCPAPSDHDALDADAILESLVRFCRTGLTAPVSSAGEMG